MHSIGTDVRVNGTNRWSWSVFCRLILPWCDVIGDFLFILQIHGRNRSNFKLRTSHWQIAHLGTIFQDSIGVHGTLVILIHNRRKVAVAMLLQLFFELLFFNSDIRKVVWVMICNFQIVQELMITFLRRIVMSWLDECFRSNIGIEYFSGCVELAQLDFRMSLV